jgi:rubrerythrin
MANLFETLKNEIIDPLKKRAACAHAGETGPFCAQCGADLRAVTSYECRVCGLRGRPKMYPADKAPDFCSQCGAPKITFRKIRKKRGGPA